MPTTVEIGQSWSVWVPGRQQWLLAAVARQSNGQATLKYDIRYGMAVSDSEYVADETTMLTTSNLFRFVKA